MNNGSRLPNSQQCTGWCTPTIIYLGISVLSILVKTLSGNNDHPYSFTLLLAQVLYTAFGTGIIYWLCANCFSKWSWFIILPLGFMRRILF